MHRARALSALLLLALAAASGRARADDCHPTALTSTCINDDTFWPHAGASQFVGVGGADVTGEGRLGFGLVTDYLSRPITLTLPSPSPGSKAYVIDDQVNGTFLWSYGVTRRLELDVAVPITFGQGGTGLEPVTAGAPNLQDTAIRDMRFGLTYAILERPADSRHGGFGLTGRFEVSAPTGDRTQFAGDRTVVFVPSIAGEYRNGRWFAGAELGVRARPNESLLGATEGTQGVIGLGVGYDLLKQRGLLGVMLEGHSLPTFASQRTTQVTDQGLVTVSSSEVLAPSEWMIGLRSSPLRDGDLSVQVAGGGPIPTGDADLTVPRFRFVLGVRFTPGSADRDHDGVADELDACPGIAAKTSDGCPAAPTPTAAPKRDVPRLDLDAAKDACHEDPDTVDGFKDTDGCPDEDTDHDGVDDRYDRCPLAAEDYAGLADGCPEPAKAAAPASPSPSSPPSAAPPSKP